MKLPETVIISPEKLLHYLLLFREENDKSRFLATAGYTSANWEALARDLRQLAQQHEISSAESSPYGTKYEVRGTLQGPNGYVLYVVTIWITLAATGETRFVTLFPDRERQR
ncbi:MAG: hypothetical protein KatS3mg131_1852 [Candidatus Tectimicrobiota bacterium]|nr:MAG: hypothetical protein KatS3mg131_1852 [Candidatus Tectomicrobia bacterium]